MASDQTSDDKSQISFRNETYFRNLFELSRDGIFIYDLDGRLQDVNAQFCDMLGYEAKQMLGRYVSDFRPEALDDHIEKVYQELVTQGSVRFESQFIRQDGHVIDVDVSASIFDADKGFGQAIVRDISDHKLLEETQRKTNEALEQRVVERTADLQESERRFRTLIEHAADALFLHDLSGRLLDVNQQACESLGYTREELLELTVVDVDMNFKQEMLEALWESLPPNQPKTLNGIHRRKDGTEFPVEVRVGRVIWAGERAVLGIARDVTERKRLEVQLMQSQKMEAVGKLAGGIAHDFNNLLTVINGYSEQILARLEETDISYAQMQQILRSGQRAAGLIDQLLAFSRRQTLQPKVLDLNLLIADMLKLLHRLIGEDIELVASLSASGGLVKADPHQLEQVLMNLVVNARDAMPQGGNLKIATANVDVDTDFAQRHDDLSVGEYVTVMVEDTGCGIDAKTIPHIFEPFFTTKGQGEGTGLGLSMVYGVVAQSGGCVTVESALGQGTRFQVFLPLHDDVSVAEPEEDAGTPSGGTETILLVEDEEVVRGFARYLLEKWGYTVLEALDGQAALGVFEAHPGDVDVLLTDVIMPEMSGQILAERLVAQNPQLKVIYMSGYTHDFIGRHGELDEHMIFIQKPFTQENLLFKVREALDG